MEKQSVSSITRRPWGGLLDAPASNDPAEVEDSVHWLGVGIRKFAELSLLSTLVAVPLMYHYSLLPHRTASIQFILERIFGDDVQPFFHHEILPFVSGLLSNLESKFSAWLVLGIAMMAAYAGVRVMEAVFRRRFFPQPENVGAASRKSRHRLIPLVAISVYIVYSLVSFLFWAPEAPPAAQAVAAMAAEEAPWYARLGGGGFFFSTQSWLQMTFALFFFLVAEDMIRDRHLVNKILGLIVFVGLLNAIVVVLQKIEFPLLVDNWIRFGPEDTRNNLGAFIGHNTGVSSLLMAPVLISLSWLLGVQPVNRAVFRMVLAAGLGVMALALLLAQSRAVVPILAVAAPAMLVLMARRSALLPRSRFYFWLPALLAAVVLTQIISSPLNPLYRRDISLIERVTELRPEHLQTETRRRILVVSLAELTPIPPFSNTIAPGPLLIGNGFGSFQYVYPKAQGDYFQKYPRSTLVPTALRTTQAHNEYLQTLVETGLIGLGIVLAGLYFLLRGGWDVMSRTLMPYHISAQAAVFVSIIAYLAHCTVDFPLRIPPLALTLIVLLAIWSAGDRLWIFPIRAPQEEEPIQATREKEKEGSGITYTPPKQSWWRAHALASAAGLVGLLVFVGLGVGVGMVVGPFQTANSLVLRAEAYLRAYFEQGGESRLVQMALQDLKAARRIYWISGPINRLNGHAQYYNATMGIERADELARAGRFAEADKMRRLALTLAQTGITDTNLALAEELFHKLYQQRAALYNVMAENTTGVQRDSFRSQMLSDMSTAANMNPGDPETLLVMIQTLEPMAQINRTEIVRYMSTLNYFHPRFFREKVFGRVLDALALAEFDTAARLMAMIHEAAPEDEDLLIAWASVAFGSGDVSRAREIASAYLERAPETPETLLHREAAQFILTQIAISSGNNEVALRDLEKAETEKRHISVPSVLANRYFLLDRFPDRKAERSELEASLIRAGTQDPAIYQVVGDAAFKVFRNYRAAVEWLERRRAAPAPAPPMDLQGHVLLAKSYARLGQWDKVRELLPKLREIRSTPYAMTLARRVAADLEKQASEAEAEQNNGR